MLYFSCTLDIEDTIEGNVLAVAIQDDIINVDAIYDC